MLNLFYSILFHIKDILFGIYFITLLSFEIFTTTASFVGAFWAYIKFNFNWFLLYFDLVDSYHYFMHHFSIALLAFYSVFLCGRSSELDIKMSSARRFIQATLDKQISLARTISDHFETEVVLFDPKGYFEDATTKNFGRINYLFKNNKYALLSHGAQVAWDDTNSYMQYVNDVNVVDTKEFVFYHRG